MISRLRKAARSYSDDALSASRADLGAAPAESWTWDAGDDASLGPRGASRDALETLSAIAAAQRGGRGSGGGKGESGSDGGDRGLLTDKEIEEIERSYADGITAAQVVDIFVSRGVRFSEATFRKYVQQGLLPRSRRVGRKGKHRGSLGVYPAKTVRRVNDIKRLMADDFTIEEIQQQYLRFTNVLESIEEGIEELFALLEEEAQHPQLDAQARRALKRELAESRKLAADLGQRLDGLTRRVGEPRGDRYRDSGAAGSAEDLL